LAISRGIVYSYCRRAFPPFAPRRAIYSQELE